MNESEVGTTVLRAHFRLGWLARLQVLLTGEVAVEVTTAPGGAALEARADTRWPGGAA